MVATTEQRSDGSHLDFEVTAERQGAPAATSPDPTPEEAAALIARLFPEVYRRFHSARRLAGGAELPITRRALEVLQHLASAGPLTIGEQAEHLGLRRNSTSELVSRLAARGLVARIRDERDERRVLVWLTDAGRDVVARIGQILAPDLLVQVLSGMDREDRAAIIAGMELLARGEPFDPADPADPAIAPTPTRPTSKGAPR